MNYPDKPVAKTWHLPLTRRAVQGLLLLLAAAVAIWWGLNRAERRPDWLRVEAPRAAVVGRPFRVRLYLGPLPEAGFVSVDLHYSTAHDTPMQYLCASDTKPVGQEGGIFEFDIPVPPREGMRFLMGVVCITRTGNWRDHTRAANTDFIPIASATETAAPWRLEPLGLQPEGTSPANTAARSPVPRILTGLLFLAAVIAATTRGAPAKASNSGPGAAVRWWQGLVVLLALACLWELLGLENWLGNRARALVSARDLYYERGMVQKVVISATVAAAFLVLPLILRVPRAYRLVLAALALYLLVALVNLISLHSVDRVASLTWHGVSVARAIKLACVATILLALYRMRR